MLVCGLYTKLASDSAGSSQETPLRASGQKQVQHVGVQAKQHIGAGRNNEH